MRCDAMRCDAMRCDAPRLRRGGERLNRAVVDTADAVAAVACGGLALSNGQRQTTRADQLDEGLEVPEQPTTRARSEGESSAAMLCSMLCYAIRDAVLHSKVEWERSGCAR